MAQTTTIGVRVDEDTMKALEARREQLGKLGLDLGLSDVVRLAIKSWLSQQQTVPSVTMPVAPHVQKAIDDEIERSNAKRAAAAGASPAVAAAVAKEQRKAKKAGK